jgi:hypothetical protein
MLQLPSPTPDDFIPFFGMATGIFIVAIIGFTMLRIAKSQIGQAIARRIHGSSSADPELQGEVLELREHVAMLEDRLAQNEERLDFTERLLAQQRVPAALPGVAQPESEKR